jgi:predicted permease
MSDVLLGVTLSEDDLRKIETRRSISGLYVKVCIVMLVHVLVLSAELTVRYGNE